MNSTKKINAVFINCIDEDDVLMLAIGDDKQDPKNFFIISRFDEEGLSVDECIGFQNENTSFEIPSAIESIELSKSELIITLNDDAAEKSGTKKIQSTFNHLTDPAVIEDFLHVIFADASTEFIINLGE
ncbi:hypothetical protein [Serratia proteamaculans]